MTTELLGLDALAASLTAFPERRPVVGLLTLDNPQARRTRVFINDLDVTRRCVAADDRQGWAVLYDEPAIVTTRPDRIGLATSVATGVVRFEAFEAREHGD